MLGETRSGLNLWGRIRRTPKKRGGSPRRYGVQVQTGREPSTEALRAAAQASE